MQELNVGDDALLEARFTDVNGNLANPTTVTLTITSPDGTVQTVNQAGLTNPSVGYWTYTLVASQAGAYTYKYVGTGAIVRSETDYFIVAGGPSNTLHDPWATLEDVTGCSGVPSGINEGVLIQSLWAASDLLWRWSGFRWGGIAFDTVRPCAQNTYMDSVRSWDLPLGGSYGYYVPSWGACACQANVHRGCGCQLLSEVELGRAPVRGIIQVRQDGAVLAPSAYRLDDYGWLVRIDGSRWPCCQRMDLPDSQPNTWAVDFLWGQNPPPSGVRACIDLTIEYARACGGDDCAIPENVASRIRQGETMVFLPPQAYGRDALGHIRAGIRSVDFFLTAVGTSRPAMVHTVDWDATVRRTSTDTRR